jgi:ActR/RegA family two-component response regulator
MADTDDLMLHHRPTATRPLLGLTVLVVEDSRYSSDAMRLLCLRSGARIRRADCLMTARRHLQVYRPGVMIVDLGLPDGSGADLISEVSQTAPRVDVILGTSGDSFAEDVAIAAGADGFLAKPVTSVDAFQRAILEQLPSDRRPTGPRLVGNDPVRPDPIAYRDDMALAAEMLDNRSDPRALDYVTQFLWGVAYSAGDHALQAAAEDFSQAFQNGQPQPAIMARLAGLVQERLSDRVAI